MTELPETARSLAIVHQAMTAEHFGGVRLLDAKGRELARAGVIGEDRTSQGDVRQTLRAYHQELGQLVWQEARESPSGVAERAAEEAARALARVATMEYELDHLSQELVDSYESIHMLCDVTDGWAHARTLQDLYRVLVETLCQSVPCRSAAVLTVDGPEHARVEVVRGGPCETGLGERLELTPLLRRVLERQVIVLLAEDELSSPEWASEPLARCARRSLLVIPMVSDGEALGALVLWDRQHSASPESAPSFEARDAKLGRAVASQGAAMILRRRAADTTRELDLGRRIQRSLLPEELPHTPSVTAAGMCVMARVVGGDFYDVLCPTPGLINALIADVSGHDVGAALLMATARALFRMDLQDSRSPAATLRRLNRLLGPDLRRTQQFLTCFLVCFDQEEGVLRYAGAGHPPAILWGPAEGRQELLDSTGLPLGVEAGAEYAERSCRVEHGQLLLLYTDGLTEARDPRGRMFGEEGVSAVLRDHQERPVREILERLDQAVLDHHQAEHLEDDGTALLLRFRVPDEARAVAPQEPEADHGP